MSYSMPSILYFTASWCGPCKLQGPMMEKASEDYSDRLNITKVDIERENDLVKQYGIKSIPCVVLLDEKDAEINRVVGFISRNEFDAFVSDIV